MQNRLSILEKVSCIKVIYSYNHHSTYILKSCIRFIELSKNFLLFRILWSLATKIACPFVLFTFEMFWCHFWPDLIWFGLFWASPKLVWVLLTEDAVELFFEDVTENCFGQTNLDSNHFLSGEFLWFNLCCHASILCHLKTFPINR